MGVAHHANFFRWFEMGRVEYLRQAGIYLLDLMEDGILFPITEVSCQYRSPARFDDSIMIETTMTELSKAKMVFTYQVIKEPDQMLLAAGQTQNVFTDRNGRIIRLPQLFYEKLEKMFRQENSTA